MSSNKHPGEGLVTTAANYIFWFLVSNFYFLILNLPFLLVFSASYSQTHFSFSILLILSLLSVGPALAALFSVMEKLVRNKSVSVTRDYFSAYKKNFFDGLFYGGFFITLLVIVYLNILYLRTKPNLYFLQVVMLIIGIVIIAVFFYVFPIISRFYFKFTDVLRLSILYAIKKPHITAFNLICLLALIILISKLPTYFILFSFSIFCYVIMLNERNILKEIEERYKK